MEIPKKMWGTHREYRPSLQYRHSPQGSTKELNVYGSSLSPRCFPKVIEGIYSGKIKADGVVTHEFALDDYLEALETSGKGAGSIKVAFVNK